LLASAERRPRGIAQPGGRLRRRMLIGNGYAPGHDRLALNLQQTDAELGATLERRLRERVS